jgi:hypothetical protein
MTESRINSETVIEVESLKEALTVDTEMKDINILIINNVTTKGNWRQGQELNHIPDIIKKNPKNYGRIIIRVGLGYHYLYDTLNKSWVKPVDTNTREIINKYLTEK